MLNRDLDQTHPLHTEMLPKWRLYMAAFEGVDALIEHGALLPFEGETEHGPAYQRRKRLAYGFNHTKSVVEWYNHHLFSGETERDLGPLADLPEFKAFLGDCDRQGSDYDIFLREQAKTASIYGSVGLLVDAPKARKDGAVAGHPYVVAYEPETILDWTHDRDETGAPMLASLKLLDGTGDDQTWLVWTRTRFDRFAKSKTLSGDENPEAPAIHLGGGDNPLGYIPFYRLYGAKGRRPEIGVSDVRDVHRLDLSTLNDLSALTEAVAYAGFPMLLHPAHNLLGGAKAGVVEVGPKAVLFTDPERPTAKPEWLTPPIRDVVEAVLAVVKHKADEAFRISHVKAVVDSGNVAKSGAALSAEFSMLNAVLARKSAYLEEAERGVLRSFCDWLGRPELGRELGVKRPRLFGPLAEAGQPA